jgi:hypothetical protein
MTGTKVSDGNPVRNMDAIALQIIKNCWQYILLTSFQINSDIYWLLGDNWSVAIIPAIKKAGK